MAGYLGKISAVVSVNTGDFAQKLNRAKGDVADFAAATSRSITASSQKSARAFGSIYTEVQKLERALRAAQTEKLDLKGFEGRDLAEAANNLRQIHSVAVQISKPLADAAAKSESMSMSIRRGIHPALVDAQGAAQALQDRLKDAAVVGEREFKRVETVVRRLAEAMSRAGEADAMVGKFTGGRDFRSQAPGAFSAIERAAGVQKSLYALPAGAISGSDNLLARQKAAATGVAAAYSALEAARARGMDDSAEQAALDKKIARLDRVNALINQQIEAYNAQEAAARRAAETQVMEQRLAAVGMKFGASSPVSFSTPFKPGLRGPAGPVSTGVGAFTDITGMGAASQLRPGYLQGVTASNRQAAMTAAFGEPMDASSRKVDALKANINILQNEVEKLPEPLIATFIPALDKIRNRFLDLGANPAESDIRRLAAGVDGLTNKAQRFAEAVKFKGTFKGFLNESATKTYTSQLDAIQRKMAALGAEANGPVGAAIDAFRQKLAYATAQGTAGTEKTRIEMRALAWDIMKAGVAARLFSEAEGKAFLGGIMRTGDVGRMGLDKYSLALQQAIFIVDDFTSASGGMDMKIRAVQNNMTQLGFIIGNTTGLFIGLGAALVGQVAAGVYKWLNSGRSSEDQAKALNDALEKQKNLVEELAKSFDGLTESISQSAMSSEALAGRKLDKELDRVRQQQKEAREESLYRMSPDVANARASQNVAKVAAGKATTVAEMLAAQNAMDKAMEDEEKAKAGVRARAAAGVASPEAFSAIVRSFRSEARLIAELKRAKEMPFAGGEFGENAPAVSEGSILTEASRLAEQWLERNVIANAGNSRDALRNREAEVLAKGSADANQVVADLRRAIDIIELPLKEGADDISIAVSRASSEAASKIKEAQDRVAEAIQAGAPGAAMFSVTLGKTAEALTSAQDKVLAAFKESDPERRRAMADEAKREVDALVGTIDKQLSSARGMMFEGLGVKGGRGGELGGVRRVAGAGEALAALEGSAEFGGRSGPRAVALRALIAKESAARADLARAMTFGGGNQRVQAAMGLEAVQDQLQKFTDGLPEEIKAAGDAVKAASKQSGKDAATQAQLLDRGRDLILSPKQKAVAAFRKDLEAASVAAAGPDRAALLSQFMRNRATEVAPLLSQFAQERGLAAMAQYTPALQASDVTTQEGQREINRLLRGEDSAKDVNLAELKQQTELLSQLVEIAQKDQDLVVDFK